MTERDATVELAQWGPAGPEGDWQVHGVRPEVPGSKGPYEGSLTLERDGDVFLATWRSPQLGTLTGTGILYQGQLLLARRKAIAGVERPGIVQYVLAASGDLAAVWNAAPLGARIGTGRATGGRPETVFGTRPITYYGPNGNVLEPANLELVISAVGDEGASLLVWQDRTNKKDAYKGVGLPVANGLAAAWAGANPEPVLEVLVFDPVAGSSGVQAEASWARSEVARRGGESILRVGSSGYATG